MTWHRAQAARRERSAAVHVPYSAHVAPTVIRTVAGDYLQALRLGGASFESADDDQLNVWHERLNVLWRNLASPNLALWTHLVRRPVEPEFPARPGEGFANGLHARYAQRLAREHMMVNELYVALLHRPAAGAAANLVTRALARSQRTASAREMADALDTCAKLAQTVRASLQRYEPEPLGTYRHGDTCCSALLEYLALLANAEAVRVPLPGGPLNEALVTTRLLFGSEAIEYRAPAATRVGAILGMFSSIRSVAVSAAAALEYVAAQRARDFSVRHWVSQGRGVLFIPYAAAQIAALRSIIAMWVRLAIFETLNRPGADQRLWFVVDELDSLGAIDGLKDALTRLRKFGGRCVLGFQSASQVSSTYGADAQTIIENCGNSLILRCSGSEHGGTSQFASRLIGEREVIRRQTARGRDREGLFAARGARRSTNTSEQHVIETAVLAAQIEQLPDLAGYLKTAASPAWVQVRIAVQS